MKIERRFDLAASPQVVWELLKDTHLMARCLPGAELADTADGDNLTGRLSVRLGPIVAGFDGSVAITRDESARGGTMQARGVDKRTGTRVRADIGYALSSTGGATAVTLTCELSLMGTLAQFARQSLIDKVTSELIRGFCERLESRLGEDT